jgi:hypothetical protein
MMEAVRTSEMSVYFNGTTRRYIPEGCHFHTRRCEKLKSQQTCYDFRCPVTVSFGEDAFVLKINFHKMNDINKVCVFFVYPAFTLIMYVMKYYQICTRATQNRMAGRVFRSHAIECRWTYVD